MGFHVFFCLMSSKRPFQQFNGSVPYNAAPNRNLGATKVGFTYAPPPSTLHREQR
jgi:hypothetical protein